MACSSSDTDPTTSNGELIFQSGFESSSVGVPANAHLDMTGIDTSVPAPNDWIQDLDQHPNIGDFTFQYEGGDETERYVRLIQDPIDPQNQALQFWLQHANVEKDGVKFKGRVQANIYNNEGLSEIYQKVRMYFPSDFASLEQAPTTFGWLTIFEFWNNPEWRTPDLGFRVTVNVKKLSPEVNTPLTFGVHGQVFEDDRYKIHWEEDAHMFSIPKDQWLTVEIYFVDGDTENGRFYMAVTPENEQKVVLFDITNTTQHPNDTNPDGLTHYNPMKLYTSRGLIDHVRDNDMVLQLYWDDFELWKGRKPM